MTNYEITISKIEKLPVSLLREVDDYVFDETSARQFGQLKADLERSGNVVADLDLQIASIALTNDAILVTHNQKHFSRIPSLKLDFGCKGDSRF